MLLVSKVDHWVSRKFKTTYSNCTDKTAQFWDPAKAKASLAAVG